MGVRAPIQGGDSGVKVGEGADELKGEEILAEARRAPYLDEFAGCNGDEGAVGTEPDCADGVLEGNAVKDDAAAEVDEESAVVVVDGEDEDGIGGDCEAGDVGGGLAGEGGGG